MNPSRDQLAKCLHRCVSGNKRARVALGEYAGHECDDYGRVPPGVREFLEDVGEAFCAMLQNPPDDLVAGAKGTAAKKEPDAKTEAAKPK